MMVAVEMTIEDWSALVYILYRVAETEGTIADDADRFIEVIEEQTGME